MVVMKKYLVIFGGYYDNLRNCRFYNDTYLFNLETERWDEMKWTSTGLTDCPAPRSACQLTLCAKNNTIVMYGGFSKEKLKKERERGIVHSDMYVLHHEGTYMLLIYMQLIKVQSTKRALGIISLLYNVKNGLQSHVIIAQILKNRAKKYQFIIN